MRWRRARPLPDPVTAQAIFAIVDGILAELETASLEDARRMGLTLPTRGEQLAWQAALAVARARVRRVREAYR